MENLTQIVISYEITTHVKFCRSHDLLKSDFVASKFKFILIRKCIADTVVVNDVTRKNQYDITCGYTNNMYMTLSTEYQ